MLSIPVHIDPIIAPTAMRRVATSMRHDGKSSARCRPIYSRVRAVGSTAIPCSLPSRWSLRRRAWRRHREWQWRRPMRLRPDPLLRRRRLGLQRCLRLWGRGLGGWGCVLRQRRSGFVWRRQAPSTSGHGLGGQSNKGQNPRCATEGQLRKPWLGNSALRDLRMCMRHAIQRVPMQPARRRKVRCRFLGHALGHIPSMPRA